jgi:hypothetical protein
VEALLIHELAHIRRHDYLVNLLQSVARRCCSTIPRSGGCPSHIRAERERCCDDAAVAVSGDVLEYVNALAELEGSRHAHLAPSRPMADRSPIGSRACWASRGPRLGGEVPCWRGCCWRLRPTESSRRIRRARFQAASSSRTRTNPPNRMVRPLPGGRLTARNANLLMLIVNAYGVQRYQLIGGPAWMETDGFDIEAKGEGE